MIPRRAASPGERPRRGLATSRRSQKLTRPLAIRAPLAAACLLAVAGLALARPSTPALRTDATPHCKGGYSIGIVNGRSAKRYCGPAQAYVVAGDSGGEKPLPGADYRFRSGACFTQGKVRSVELGTLLIGGDSFVPYFGLVFRGRHQNTVLTATFGENNYLATHMTLKLNAAGTRGTFTTKDLLTGVRLAGWFRC